MAMKLNPYLSFRDSAREAIEFYKTVFGGDLTISTFGEANASDDPAEADKVMHSELVTEAGFTIMASDTPARMELDEGSSVTVSLSGDDVPGLTLYWDRLAAGATITLPFVMAPWGDTFGMLKDKFGITWMVNAAGSPAQ